MGICWDDADDGDFDARVAEYAEFVGTNVPCTGAFVEPWSPSAEEALTSPSAKSSSSSSCQSFTPKSPAAVHDDAGPFPKRVRLYSKQACPAHFRPSAATVQLPVVNPTGDASAVSLSPCSSAESSSAGQTEYPDESTWTSWPSRKQYLWSYEAVRLFWSRSKSFKDQRPDPMDYRTGRKVFGNKSAQDKLDVAKLFLQESKPPSWIVQFVEETFLRKKQTEKESQYLGKTLLLTFNGAWGVSEQWIDGSKFSDLDGLVKHIRQQPSASLVWNDFLEYCKELANELHCSDWAASAEVCTSTYECSSEGRLHLHVWLRSNRRLWIPASSLLVFRDSQGVQSNIMAGQPSSARQAGFQGALYLSERKIGSVFSFSTRRMFSDYIIQPVWVLNLLQCRKITHATAKSLIVKSCQNVSKYMQDLQVLEEEQARCQAEAASRRVLSALNDMAKPFHCLPEVEEWKKQFEGEAFRFKFLVLEGPSRIGKTVFARMTLTPPGREFYELNCAGEADLNLRGLQPLRHGLVIFDEISPVQVIRQKKVFQAGPTEIQLGQSSTSVFGYSKWLYKMRMVCCSNVWSSVLRHLPHDDHDWLVKNSVHIIRNEPLFISDK